jgi:N-methylhydantoinase A/oxoprolinase/acetone carboxylase beta subunit
MAIALGLDAGGTYTDAALYDLANNKVLASAKSPTTPPTYINGVAGAVRALPADIRAQASFVALSTTLATNAIVEGRHAPAGLLLIGYDKHETNAVKWNPKRCVAGRHSIRGLETIPFDEAAFKTVLNELIDEGVSGLAISAVMSTRNPDHERRAVDIARATTDLPIVAGHEVAGVLNAVIRAETAALNAGLIPIIHRFIHAVETVIEEAGLSGVKTYMVTGDGSLMSSEAARLRPVETILSGPACSVLGAARLSGVENAVVADIGGTTTDIASLDRGMPRMAPGGVTVGNWRAGIRSAQVITRGLGGDSAICVDKRVTVGPGRVMPISRLGSMSPAFAESMQRLIESVTAGDPPGGDWRLTNPTDAFLRLDGDAPAALSGDEQKILDALADGPLTRLELGERVEYPFLSLLRADRLEAWGLVQCAGLTPTDLWHVSGKYAPWDEATALAAAKLAAFRLGLTVEELTVRVDEMVTQALARQVTQAHLDVDHEGCAPGTLAGALAQIALGEVPTNGLVAKLSLKPPIVGVGAPAGLFLGPVADRIGGNLIVPEGAAVANAVGAAIGAVMASAEALVRPQESGEVLCYAPEERREYDTRDEAVQWAGEVLLPAVEAELSRRGARTSTIRIIIEHRGTELADSPEPMWWDTLVTAQGTGHPMDSGVDSADAASTDTVIETVERWTPGLQEVEALRDEEYEDAPI